MMLRVIVVVAFMLCFVDEAVQQKANCNMTLLDVDKCGIKLIPFTDREVIVPTNEAEMETHCELMKDAMRCFRQYQRNCMASYPKQVFSLFTHDVRKEVKKRCNSPRGRTEFLKHIVCIQDKARFEEVYKCMDDYISQIEYIVKEVKRVNQISTSCCAFHLHQKCIREKTGAMCDSVTGPQTKEYVNKLITAIVKEALDFTCGIYQDINACHSNLPKKLMGPMMEMMEKGSSPTYKSPMAPLITMFTDVD